MQTVLITGASSGIGEALAKHYAQNGIKNLYLCGRNKERLETVAKTCTDLGAKVTTQILNVQNREKVKKWIFECNLANPLDLVIANAGISNPNETAEGTYNTFNTNIFGVLNTVTPAVEIFAERPTNNMGQIAIVASIAGYHGLAACPAYSASKACVKAYGEALRVRFKKQMKISVICPGFVRSRITDQNTCPMPFFMEAEPAANIIAARLEKNIGLIAFPWPVRFGTWLVSILPNCLSDFIYGIMPYKV